MSEWFLFNDVLINIYNVEWISPLTASLKHARSSRVNPLLEFSRLFYSFCFHWNKQELMKLHSVVFAPSWALAACPWWSFSSCNLYFLKLFSKLQCDVFWILTLNPPKKNQTGFKFQCKHQESIVYKVFGWLKSKASAEVINTTQSRNYRLN